MILTTLKPFSWASRRYSSTTSFTSRGGIVCRSKTSVISISTGSGKGLSESLVTVVVEQDYMIYTIHKINAKLARFNPTFKSEGTKRNGCAKEDYGCGRR